MTELQQGMDAQTRRDKKKKAKLKAKVGSAAPQHAFARGFWFVYPELDPAGVSTLEPQT